jgi:hypothetical protein
MQKSINHRGYEVVWQDPPLTSAGYDLSIAAADSNLQRQLEIAFACKGAYTFRSQGSLESALTEAKKAIETALGHNV